MAETDWIHLCQNKKGEGFKLWGELVEKYWKTSGESWMCPAHNIIPEFANIFLCD